MNPKISLTPVLQPGDPAPSEILPNWFSSLPSGHPPAQRAMLGVKAVPASGDPSHPNCIDIVASTGIIDRTGEIIEPSGWRLESYRKNPVFQNAHRYGDVIHTLGRAIITEVVTLDGKPALYQRVEFAVDVNPVARIACGLYKGGFLNAVSVGFIPLKWEDGGPGCPWQRRYIESELLEVSAVAIPANPEALALGLKSGAVIESDLAACRDLLCILLAFSPHDQNSAVFLKSLHTILRENHD